MKLLLWPRSLATRTAAVLLGGLVTVQAIGLFIHTLDRIDLQRLAQVRDVGFGVMSLYRSIAMTPPEQRQQALREMELPPWLTAQLQPGPPNDMLGTPVQMQRLVHANMNVIPVPGPLRPKEYVMLGGPAFSRLDVGMRLPDGPWLNVVAKMPPPSPWHSSTLLLAFLLMTAVAALLSVWAVRRLTAPVATLAAAAERLGRDVNAPPLPEEGPTEVATAAAAFNLMAARIRRFVQDRTFMLTAIGHDLRTPITRLKLRAEFMEDDDLRRKMLADLDEMEAMVSATLTFGRDATSSEPVTPLDLPALIRTVLDETADARPDLTEKLSYHGPAHLTVKARSNALKRALSNLVGNAATYGGSVHAALDGGRSGLAVLAIEDDGPGIPPAELDRVFEPFHRVEGSRNRETGGVGLGLPIARNILRAHGGDVSIANRSQGGARVTVTLPV
jgi:signal transduction histidine kinase